MLRHDLWYWKAGNTQHTEHFETHFTVTTKASRGAVGLHLLPWESHSGTEVVGAADTKKGVNKHRPSGFKLKREKLSEVKHHLGGWLILLVGLIKRKGAVTLGICTVTKHASTPKSCPFGLCDRSVPCSDTVHLHGFGTAQRGMFRHGTLHACAQAWEHNKVRDARNHYNRPSRQLFQTMMGVKPG